MKRIVRKFVVAFSALGVVGGLSPMAGAAGGAGQRNSSATASIAGVVCDSAGTPQVGIVVELLRKDASPVARVFTDRKGIYSIASVLPGQYALKAVGGEFLPMVKQNLRVRANTIVNLTLNNLYDLMQWTPQPQRTRANAQDDWAWTLRSAQSRPLLRWQEDGSPILIWDGGVETRSGNQSKRRLRLLATAGETRFGSSGQSVSAAMLKDTSDRRRVAASASVDPGVAGMMDMLIGFRQQLTDGGMGSRSMQSLIAISADPSVGAGPDQGLQAAAFRTWESIEMLGGLEAEAGSDQVLARVGNGTQLLAARPFARLTLHRGQGSLEYRVATSRGEDPGADEAMPEAWLPILSERDGELVMEHGLHQELGWSTSAGPAEMHLIFYGDSIADPMIEASGRLSAGEEAGPWMLVDRASGLLRSAGPNYSTTGMLASVESRLPGHNRVKLSYASGDALVMHATARPADVAAILQRARAHRAQMCSLALSGTVEGSETRWRASYRWQPDATVTEVAPFAVDASELYLNIYIRQPIRFTGATRQGPGGLEAQLDMRNLLAEGYQPVMTSDGSRLYFAQAQRSIRGGLAFTF